jgi:predicted AAA+ superfamily ATPase
MSAVPFFPAIVVTGARQVGKSTFLKRLFPHHHYVSLDSPMVAEEAETHPEVFFAKNPAPVILDEIQYAPKLFRNLKQIIDRNPSIRGAYILTGSQKFELMKGVSESLAGRIALFELEGLSQIEVINQGLNRDQVMANTRENSLSWLIKSFERGGFPQLWAEQSMPLDVFYSSYTGTYLERDVRQLISVTSLRDFERFLRACAIRSGQILNKSDLARDVGIAPSTASEWLGALDALGHIVLLEPWFSNLGKRLTKAPKLFLRDVGLLCHLLGLHGENILRSPNIGAIWETFVFAEIRKQLIYGSKNRRIWFYRDQSQLEVDFILEDGFDCTLYECKWTSNPDSKATANLHKVESIFKDSKDYKIVEKVLICRSSEEITRDDVHFRPVEKAIR